MSERERERERVCVRERVREIVAREGGKECVRVSERGMEGEREWKEGRARNRGRERDFLQLPQVSGKNGEPPARSLLREIE